MTLGFSTTWPKTMPQHMSKQPTYFVEKVWKSLLKYGVRINASEFVEFGKRLPEEVSDGIMTAIPKRHTIRRDQYNKWHPGKLIHPVINNRSKDRFQFTPVLKCVSTQSIEILWKDVDGFKTPTPTIYVDGKWIVGKDLIDLAINDGFDNITDFFSWFKTDFKGKIIHWTNLKY